MERQKIIFPWQGQMQHSEVTPIDLTFATLSLFGSVLPDKEPTAISRAEQENLLRKGVYVLPGAASRRDQILQFYQRLSHDQLNATFHKSWQRILEMDEAERKLHQITHYLSTYGNLWGEAFVYIPAEELGIPKDIQLPIRVVGPMPAEDMLQKTLDLLSGLALKTETIESALTVLNTLGYDWNSWRGFKNREATVMAIEKIGEKPTDPEAMLRYLIYKVTGSALMVKDQPTQEALTSAKISLPEALPGYEARFAEVFNRYKRLFLALKKGHPKNGPYINRVARLSKKLHRPYQPAPLESVVERMLFQEEDVSQEIRTYSPFQLARVYNALGNHHQEAVIFRIRNGKRWLRTNIRGVSHQKVLAAKKIIKAELVGRLSNLKGKYIALPDHLEYAMATSEKNFLGDFPIGTRIVANGPLAAGIYWKNQFGESVDLDLSAISGDIKIGWDHNYISDGIAYSGDVTDAKTGAAEWIRYENLHYPFQLNVNQFSPDLNHQKLLTFKLMIARAPENLTGNWMAQQDQILFELEMKQSSREMTFGLMFSTQGSNLFVIDHAQTIGGKVSKDNEMSALARKAMLESSRQRLMLKDLLLEAGAFLTPKEEQYDLDLRLPALTREKLISVMKGEI